MDAARKREIVERISAWLDDWPDDEPLPDGLDPELVDSDAAHPDLVGLATAVASCGREVQIQSKAFKRLQESVAAVVELPGLADLPDLADLPNRIERRIDHRIERHIEHHIGRLTEHLTEHLTEQQAQTQADDQGQLIGDLVELHDRLARCVAESRTAVQRLGLWSRRGAAAKTLESVVKGFELLHERAAETLARADVRTFETDGCTFDSGTMRAVDWVPADDDAESDTVAATLRRGYLQGDRVLRPAEVRVARKTDP